MNDTIKLETNLRSGGKVYETSGITRLEIPPGPAGQYRLAQLDDYHGLGRASFPWEPPVRLTLEARTSSEAIPGTWGFGFWNDPFEVEVARGGRRLRMPALPNAAWFFFASPQNYLSLNDRLPANGMLAATFASPLWPAWVLVPGLLVLPFLMLPAVADTLRRSASRIVRQDAVTLSHEVSCWHTYSLDWGESRVCFSVDNTQLFETPITPLGRLGFVLWVDNQFMAFSPRSQPRYGTLKNPDPCWIEVHGLDISTVQT